MHTEGTVKQSSQLAALCMQVREYTIHGQYTQCKDMICQAMESHPHAPQPHNLFGIVLELEGDHVTAMKHFRAAWALDPTYEPANENLKNYGSFYRNGTRFAYDETDCRSKKRYTL